jgi:outer membrane protein OmpA-like peptidoglycan-associated protein
MEGSMGNRRLVSLSIIGILVLSWAALPRFAPLVFADDQPTEAQILDALSPRKTRGVPPGRSSDTQAAAEQQFIEGLRTRSARSLRLEDREKAAEFSQQRPSIDLEINFDFNSAVVGPATVPLLLALGRALSKDEFKGTVFLINGHTDAKGSLEYNQDLSERRAEAVKKLLVEQFGMAPTTLIAIGYGKSHLKNAVEPFAAENRRVQVVNTGVK